MQQQRNGDWNVSSESANGWTLWTPGQPDDDEPLPVVMPDRWRTRSERDAGVPPGEIVRWNWKLDLALRAIHEADGQLKEFMQRLAKNGVIRCDDDIPIRLMLPAIVISREWSGEVSDWWYQTFEPWDELEPVL